MKSPFSIPLCTALLAFLLATDRFTDRADAEEIPCYADRDNTIFQGTTNSNGAGSWLAAGKTNKNGQIQRALLHFDFSAIPPHATITSAALDLYVVGVPLSDVANTRQFWLQTLDGIGSPSWGEGDSDAGTTGQGAVPSPGDATWFHKQYDTVPWPDGRNGALGTAAVTYDAAQAVGSVPGNIEPTPTSPFLVHWTNQSDRMAAEIQAWIDGTTPNDGWVLVGDEGVSSASRRQFASREAGAYQPVMTVGYVVPEPSALVLCLPPACWLTACSAWRRRRRVDAGPSGTVSSPGKKESCARST